MSTESERYEAMQAHPSNTVTGHLAYPDDGFSPIVMCGPLEAGSIARKSLIGDIVSIRDEENNVIFSISRTGEVTGSTLEASKAGRIFAETVVEELRRSGFITEEGK